MSDKNTTPAERPLSKYDIACIPFKKWEAEFAEMTENEKVSSSDAGDYVLFLNSEGIEMRGRLDVFDNENKVGCIYPGIIMQHYRMRRKNWKSTGKSLPVFEPIRTETPRLGD